jgi:hypothetical protein
MSRTKKNKTMSVNEFIAAIEKLRGFSLRLRKASDDESEMVKPKLFV